MVVPFGVSVGDFIAGINLISTVINALQDSAGSSAEYKGVIRELRGLQSALEQVKDLDIDDEDQARALCGVAAECEEAILQFLQKIKKYRPILGTGRSLKK